MWLLPTARTGGTGLPLGQPSGSAGCAAPPAAEGWSNRRAPGILGFSSPKACCQSPNTSGLFLVTKQQLLDGAPNRPFPIHVLQVHGGNAACALHKGLAARALAAHPRGEPRGWQRVAPAVCWALARAQRDIKISANPQELFVFYL